MSKSRFNFYKVSVEPTENLNLFAKPRSQIFNDAFNVDEPFLFKRFNNELAYVKHKVIGDYIIASLGKRILTKLSGPPTTKFEMTEQEAWPHVLLIINTSSKQPFGQTVAVLKDKRVFDTPLIQVRSLVDEMLVRNHLLDGYDLIVNSVTSKESFWKLIKSKEGRIQRLSFNLAAPNFLGLNNKISDGMKAINKQYNATNTSLTIENPDGSLRIPKDDKFIQEAVNYATKGAGDIKLKVKEEGIIDAKRNIVSASIDSVNTRIVVESNDIETVKKICDTLFLCLKDSD